MPQAIVDLCCPANQRGMITRLLRPVLLSRRPTERGLRLGDLSPPAAGGGVMVVWGIPGDFAAFQRERHKYWLADVHGQAVVGIEVTL